ncbi:MAG: response regulator transcription factor [Clostridia bacterium]|nr:response regulator transcription factor [Clostridia bacterium]
MTNHNVFKDDFTPAEERVLKLIVKGYSNKEIGEMLNIANTTVKTHLFNIYQKSGINKFTGFSDYAVLRVRIVLKYLDKYKD